MNYLSTSLLAHVLRAARFAVSLPCGSILVSIEPCYHNISMVSWPHPSSQRYVVSFPALHPNPCARARAPSRAETRRHIGPFSRVEFSLRNAAVDIVMMYLPPSTLPLVFFLSCPVFLQSHPNTICNFFEHLPNCFLTPSTSRSDHDGLARVATLGNARRDRKFTQHQCVELSRCLVELAGQPERIDGARTDRRWEKT